MYLTQQYSLHSLWRTTLVITINQCTHTVHTHNRSNLDLTTLPPSSPTSDQEPYIQRRTSWSWRKESKTTILLLWGVCSFPRWLPWGWCACVLYNQTVILLAAIWVLDENAKGARNN